MAIKQFSVDLPVYITYSLNMNLNKFIHNTLIVKLTHTLLEFYSIIIVPL